MKHLRNSYNDRVQITRFGSDKEKRDRKNK